MIELTTDLLRVLSNAGLGRHVEQSSDVAAPACSTFDDDLIVYARLAGPRLPITSAAGLARQFRRALISAADQPVAEIICGHVADGAPSQSDHLAVLPLPAIVGQVCDGSLLGIGLALPRSTSREGRRSVARALARLEQQGRATGGDGGTIHLRLAIRTTLVLRNNADNNACAAALQPRTWTRLCTRWASATPMALDRNPGDLSSPDPGVRAVALEAARRSIIASIRRIGLPEPAEIDVTRTCVLPATAMARRYPRFAGGSGTLARVLVHVRLRFDERIRGPIVLGAGRYLGLGMFLPIDRTWHAVDANLGADYVEGHR
jgi:CRISPR-associated protein Csb2